MTLISILILAALFSVAIILTKVVRAARKQMQMSESTQYWLRKQQWRSGDTL